MTRRKLIEVALPLEAINVASAREKSIRHGHPSTLHLWWARRPLAACRAVLFASLVDDPSSYPDRFPTQKAQEDERTRLFGIIERLVLWENTTNEAVLEEARAEIRRSTGDNPPSVLDPFCGGGSIPLEAQRLGLTAYASDLNPVAVLITKALIEIPPKFANQPPVHPDARRGVGGSGAWKGAAGLAEDIRRYGAWMRDEAEQRIGHLYPMRSIAALGTNLGVRPDAWLWAHTVSCPNPGCRADLPLVRSYVLAIRGKAQVWLEPVVSQAARQVAYAVREGTAPKRAYAGSSASGPDGAKVRAAFRCPVCDIGIAAGEYVDQEAEAGRLGSTLLCAVASVNGRRYFLPGPDRGVEDAQIRARDSDVAKWLPVEASRGTFASNAQGRRYGFHIFADYFTPRQQVALATFASLIPEAKARVVANAAARGGSVDAESYARAVVTYLALAVDRSADYWSSLATWSPAGEFVAHTFTRQGVAMAWDYAEASPLGNTSGNWLGALDWIARVVSATPASSAGAAVLADATQPLAHVGLISTDPPYYDNVGFSDLSDYFYVWLRKTLGPEYPDLFGTVLTPKASELVADAYRFGGDRAGAAKHFETGISQAFTQIKAAGVLEYPFTVYYAFKQAESTDGTAEGGLASTGWETMLSGLIQSGFAVVGTWPMRTERAARSTSRGANALASSVVLVCRPRATTAGITTRGELVSALRRELPEALRTLQHGNIAPVDLAQASIGPGMAVFSRYAEVLEPDGSAMRVRTALALINGALDELLTEQEGEFDADTRWAIAWYEQFGLKDAEFGTAETLSKAKNTAVDGLVDAGILAASRGRVRLLAREEYSPEWDPGTDARIPVWEAMQRLIRALLVDGEAGAAELLARIGGIGEVARDLAYRMYHVAERKGWTEEARAYNALVVAWPDLVRGAESTRTRPVAGPAQASLGLEG